MSTETVRLIRDGEKGGYGGEGTVGEVSEAEMYVSRQRAAL